MRARRIVSVLLMPLAAISMSRAEQKDVGGPFAPVVAAAFATGFGRPLSGSICSALDLTGKLKELPVEQLSATDGSTSRSFNVSRHRGSLDIVMSRHAPGELIVLRASSEGVLVKAIRVKEGRSMEKLPLQSAAPEFEKEKAWWLEVWLKEGWLKKRLTPG